MTLVIDDACEECVPSSLISSQISLGHGGGGRLSQELLDEITCPSFGSNLESEADSALCKIGDTSIAMTTDSFVVRPRFFPGGDIGTLAVMGTANDLAMVGAKVQYLSCGLVIEEGFSLLELKKILKRMQQAAMEVGASIVTGDTKVVEKGCGDGLYINTTGIGELVSKPIYRPSSIVPGADVVLTGDLGRHGASIIAARDQIPVANLSSDCAWLGGMVLPILQELAGIYCLRDITRGGLAAVLNECAQAASASIFLREAQIPVSEPVQSLCDLLGFDPLHLANEGRCVIFSDPNTTAQLMARLHRHELGQGACIIGQVRPKGGVPVVMETCYGSQRVVPMPAGELLSRIC